MICRICNSKESFYKINSYKHYWYLCEGCRNIFSIKKKKKDSFLKIFLINFLSKITNQKRIKKLLLFESIDGDRFYEYSNKRFVTTGNYIPVKNVDNKWKKYDQEFIKYLEENNIDLTSKKILSISDEPGFIVDHLTKFTQIENITLTAYESVTANEMADKLRCKVKKFDLNKDRLSEISTEKYDLIFFRSTLNFNLDFISLFREIEKISKKNTKIIFNFHSPTIASCLMWMFDDYTLLSLINLDYINLILKKNNFEIIHSEKFYLNPRKFYYNTLFKKLFYYPFYIYYYAQIILANCFSKKKIELDTLELSHKLILNKIN